MRMCYAEMCTRFGTEHRAVSWLPVARRLALDSELFGVRGMWAASCPGVLHPPQRTHLFASVYTVY
jgi:hypothetical protein